MNELIVIITAKHDLTESAQSTWHTVAEFLYTSAVQPTACPSMRPTG